MLTSTASLLRSRLYLNLHPNVQYTRNFVAKLHLDAMASRASGTPRRFLPLAGNDKKEGAVELKGIVFDVDGTLW